jgi:hypothetical protein
MTRNLLANENFPLSAIKKLVAAGYDVKSVALEFPGIDDRRKLGFSLPHRKVFDYLRC